MKDMYNQFAARFSPKMNTMHEDKIRDLEEKRKKSAKEEKRGQRQSINGRNRASIEDEACIPPAVPASGLRRPGSGGNEESVDALTFDKARTVASVEGENMPIKAPGTVGEWLKSW